MLTASSTNAASGTTNYYHTYTYNAIGNITSSTPAGSYSYATTTSGYANPHAALIIGGTNYTYDTNGNLTNDGTWTHAWDYRNRLSQSTKTGATTTYGYDHNDMRVKLVTASTTNITPFSGYGTENGTAVKYISANGQLLATIRGTTSTAVAYYMHPDHLGSQEKTTDDSAALVQVLDYYPYLAERQNTGTLDDRKGALGKDYDSETGLNQFGSRYHSGSIGRFISQDPTFLALGAQRQLQQITGFTQNAVLSNPQLLNSYSYAGNNPITYKDPEGKFVPLLIGGIYLAMSYYGYATYINEVQDAYIKNQHPDVFSPQQIREAQNKVAVDGIITAATTGAGIAGMKVAGRVVDTITTAGSLLDNFFGDDRSSNGADPNSDKKKKSQDGSPQVQSSSGPGGMINMQGSSPQMNIRNSNFIQNQQSSGASNMSYQQQLNNLYTQFNALVQAYNSYVSGLQTQKSKQ